MSTDVLQRDQKTVRGIIEYLSKKPERRNQNRGREYFAVNVHTDGRRTISAHCEIDDRPSVMRDITYSIDGNWMPLDCFVRLTVGDRFMGSGWFRFASAYAECEAFTANEGRVSQRMDLKEPLKSFQNHAIACDAWHFKHFDLRKGGTQMIDPLLLSSPDHRGATGPMLFPIGMGMAFVGEEKLTVKAGSFKSLHFRFVSSPRLPEEHPLYDIWCTDDGNYTFLKGDIGGYMQTYYELIELKEEALY